MYLMALGALKATFSLQLKADSKPYQASPWQVAYVLQTIQGRTGAPAEAGYHYPTRNR